MASLWCNNAVITYFQVIFVHLHGYQFTIDLDFVLIIFKVTYQIYLDLPNTAKLL